MPLNLKQTPQERNSKLRSDAKKSSKSRRREASAIDSSGVSGSVRNVKRRKASFSDSEERRSGRDLGEMTPPRSTGGYVFDFDGDDSYGTWAPPSSSYKANQDDDEERRFREKLFDELGHDMGTSGGRGDGDYSDAIPRRWKGPASHHNVSQAGLEGLSEEEVGNIALVDFSF